MTVLQAAQKVVLIATGKASVVTAGSSKYNRILALLNIAKDTWADEPDVQWESLREYAEIGTVTATDTFDLGDVDHISKRERDFVMLRNPDGKIRKYTIVSGSSLYDDDLEFDGYGVCAVMGGNVVFPLAFTENDTFFGATIRVPHYPVPEDLKKPNDVIPVDNPTWACLFAASELARNDLVRQSQAAGIVAQANNAMQGMIDRNEPALDQIPADSLGIRYGETF